MGSACRSELGLILVVEPSHPRHHDTCSMVCARTRPGISWTLQPETPAYAPGSVRVDGGQIVVADAPVFETPVDLLNISTRTSPDATSFVRIATPGWSAMFKVKPSLLESSGRANHSQKIIVVSGSCERSEAHSRPPVDTDRGCTTPRRRDRKGFASCNWTPRTGSRSMDPNPFQGRFGSDTPAKLGTA